ncbi:Uma2 family endonuclease [Tundrisphaera sp. TA3]|uniref:Uma2 family endonuclease n=1 Tax=Tundrisphaera sp. TA3 TaxID=3435775 RepID=UPI003EB96893
MSTATRITVEQYEAMIARGDFEPREDHRVELIRGEIVPKDPRGPMSPIDPPHGSAVDILNEWSFEVLPRGIARVRVQGSLGIPELDSVPEPDLAWLARKDYSRGHPTPAVVLLLIEVSDSSLRKDRTTKAALYAEAGIRDYWIINIPGRCVEVRRDPDGATYRDVSTWGAGTQVRPLALPDAALDVDRLFPQPEE